MRYITAGVYTQVPDGRSHRVHSENAASGRNTNLKSIGNPTGFPDLKIGFATWTVDQTTSYPLVTAGRSQRVLSDVKACVDSRSTQAECPAAMPVPDAR